MVSILSVRLDVGQLLRGSGEIVRFKENVENSCYGERGKIFLGKKKGFSRQS